MTNFAKVISDEIEAGHIDLDQNRKLAAAREEFGRPEATEGKYADLLDK